MVDEQAIESSQFSYPGQKHRPKDFVGAYEPGQMAQLGANGRLYLVADGVGGGAAGEIASQYAIQKVLHDFYNAREPDLEKRLLTAIQETNAAIFERNNQHPERRTLSTTLLAALIHQNKLWVANVGDGRVYVVWDEDIEQLNRENSAAGETTPPEPAASAKTGSLSVQNCSIPRGLGLESYVKIETFSRRLFAGDIVVLCGGGLTGYVQEKEIAQIITKHSAEKAAERLAELVSRRGSRDNISITVARVLSKPVIQALPTPKPLPSAPNWDTLARPISAPQPVVRSQTRPLQPQPGRLLLESGTNQGYWGRRTMILAAFIVILLCLGGISLAWQSSMASELTAMLPFLNETNETNETTETTETAEIAPAEAGDQSQDTARIQTPTGGPQSPLPTPQATATRPASVPPASDPVTGDVISQTVSSGQAGPSQTAAEFVSPVPTPTPAPTIVLPPGCANRARFNGDVTVEDGEEFAAGASFDKVWSLQNAGTCPWGPGYTVRFLGGDRLNANEQVPFAGLIEPNTTGPISVSMVAPLESGNYRGNWRMYSPGGEAFGPEMYVEINVIPGLPAAVDESELTVLYDFIENAAQASWSSDTDSYEIVETAIDESLAIPYPQGLVVVGLPELKRGFDNPGTALLTHPHHELGFIEGKYQVDAPLQPADALVATLGFPRAAVLNDDGAIFEVVFSPSGRSEQHVILSRLVKYEESPVTESHTLADITPGDVGLFTVRVLGGDSLSYDWALWFDLQLVRPNQ